MSFVEQLAHQAAFVFDEARVEIETIGAALVRFHLEVQRPDPHRAAGGLGERAVAASK